MDPARVPPPSLSQYMPSGSPPPPRMHRTSHRKILIGGFIVGILLLLLTLSLLSVYSRMHILGISGTTRLAIVKAMSIIPFLPKTPEQILLAAVDSNTKVTKYTPDFSFSGAFHSTSIEAASLDIHIRGPVDYTDLDHIKLDLTATVSANLAGTTYTGTGLIRKDAAKAYGKIDTLSDSVIDGIIGLGSLFSGPQETSSESAQRTAEIRMNVQKALAYWVSYDMTVMTSEARSQLNTMNNQDSITAVVQKNANQFLLQDLVLPEVKREKDEEIEGIHSYHLSLSPSKQLISTMMRQAIEAYESRQPPISADGPGRTGSRMTEKEKQEVITLITNSLESSRTDLWIGKQDDIIRKNSSQISINLGSLTDIYQQRVYGSDADIPFAPSTDTFAAANVSFSSVLSIHDLGKSFTVTNPTQTKTPMEFMTILTDAMKTTAEKAHEQQQQIWQEDFRQLQTHLLRYYAAHNGTYPLALRIAVQAYAPSTNPLYERLGTYTYQRSSDGSNYMLYIDDSDKNRSNSMYSSTTLYGITSTSTYPHYLDRYDIEGFAIDSATPTPFPSPSYRETIPQGIDGVLGIMNEWFSQPPPSPSSQ